MLYRKAPGQTWQLEGLNELPGSFLMTIAGEI